MPIVYPHMNGYVRIDSGNNSVRIQTGGGADTTVLLDEGVYWLGGLGGTIGTDESVVPGPGESLCDEFFAKTGHKLALQFHDNPPAVVTPDETGYLYVKLASANDAIYWSHAATTVDPRWFGLIADDVPTTTFADTDWHKMSSFQAALQYTHPRHVQADRHIHEEFCRTLGPTDDGTTQTLSYGLRRGRYQEWRIEGADRESEDSTYNAMRRFLVATRGGLGMIFFPDSRIHTVGAFPFDPDANTEGSRLGYARYVIDRESVKLFQPPQIYAGYEGYHLQTWNCWEKAF